MKKSKESPSLLDSMLNYYEIGTNGTKDEKLTSTELFKFISKFRNSYELQIWEELAKKFRDKLEDQFEVDDKSGIDNEIPKDDIPFEDFLDPEIEEIIAVIADILYSAKHKVDIIKDKDVTKIILTKLNGDKKE